MDLSGNTALQRNKLSVFVKRVAGTKADCFGLPIRS
jgi:hypothetical protein